MSESRCKQTRMAAKCIGLLLLLAGVFFGTSPGATTQERRPPPGGMEAKPFLRVTPMFQGNCSPLNFRVTNTGGSNSGEFVIQIFKGSREHASPATRVDTLSVENLNAKESRAFEWSHHLNGPYTVAVRASGLTNERVGVIEIETHCIK